MKHDHIIIPTYDASMEVSDWYAETLGADDKLVNAVFDTAAGWDSHVVARGANGYGFRDYDLTLYYFLGLTVEDSDDIHFIDLPAFLALGEANGFDASAQIGDWQDRMGA